VNEIETSVGKNDPLPDAFFTETFEMLSVQDSVFKFVLHLCPSSLFFHHHSKSLSDRIVIEPENPMIETAAIGREIEYSIASRKCPVALE